MKNPEDGNPDLSVLSHRTKILHFALLLVALIAWAVIGMFFWIPFLARMTAYFVGMLATDAFTRKIDMDQVEDRFRFAIEFYPFGFRRTLEVLNPNRPQERVRTGTASGSEPTRLIEDPVVQEMIKEIVWTAVFWMLTGGFYLTFAT